MKKLRALLLMILAVFLLIPVSNGQVKMSHKMLQDKIMGGWAAQTIGVTFGGPTEFRSNSTFIQDYQPIHWNDTLMRWWFENEPGLYDDIYVDLTFVEVIEKKGIDASAADFADAFAQSGYLLWHANQAARYNLLNGLMPPESGHWLNNPHADDIDFQIEADFIGLMSPGMPVSALELSDRVGHIMNYGDGWYGGVYVATMYSLAFVSQDINYVVEEALKAIPEESKFYKVIRDVISWSEEYPSDWKQTWFEVQRKWGEDVGCPQGVFNPFNIDATVNAAWVVMGLLYGQGDYTKTFSIATRGGDDSDCNPATAGGILATMYGYSSIPDYWKQGLDQVEDIDFSFTTISLEEVYEISFRHALAMIETNGGKVKENEVEIMLQEVKPARLEIGFKDHYPVDFRNMEVEIEEEYTFEFEGVGFSIDPDPFFFENMGAFDQPVSQRAQHVFKTELYVDGKLVSSPDLPVHYTTRRNTFFWMYQLPRGRHTVTIKVKNPVKDPVLQIEKILIYDDRPKQHKH